MPLKLLIADDSTTIQKIVVLAFSCEDATVECASNGDEALERIYALKPDIVLADISMPGCSGYEICERIKEDRELADIPVILLAGTFEPFDEEEAARVKCSGHLTKPFDTSELVETVYALAGNRPEPSKPNASAEISVMDMHSEAVAMKGLSRPGSGGFISPQVWNSFLGADRILDLFDTEIFKAAERAKTSNVRPDSISAATKDSDTKGIPSTGHMLSEDLLDAIVERVMQRMSADVIREVAWEVVPELSEGIIRRTIEEQNKS
jgi:CheY-like chemotaxis protein